MITKDLENYLNTNLFQYSIVDTRLVEIDGKIFYHHDVEVPIVNDNGELSLSFDNSLFDVLDERLESLYGIIYRLGPWYLYTRTSSLATVDLEELKYLGESSHTNYFSTYLGIHGKYERMCGIGEYREWVEKAEFLGYDTLAICERSTLGGVLQFQNACDKKKIKSIIGYSLPVETSAGSRTDIKLYVKDSEGWVNLLLVNKLFQTNTSPYLEIEKMSEYSFQGLICIVEPGEALADKFINFLVRHFDDCFLQIGNKHYSSDLKDKQVLLSTQKYLDSDKWQQKLPPILVHDSYCLDREHCHLRDLLIKQGSVDFQHSTTGHYFQSSQELMMSFIGLFEDSSYQSLLQTGIQSLQYVKDNCHHRVESSKLLLPKYMMNPSEGLKYKANSDMFIELLMESFNKKIDSRKKEAWDRVLKELHIIKQGFIDYFLILWDICNWCRENDIQVGPGRGSAAGSIISYLLGITAINPLDFDLLFERFLNESRIKSEMPDIDIDFASDRRDDVIQYMKDKYGESHVCRVGTYNTLQLRGVVKELERYYGNTSEISADKLLPSIEGSNSTWKTLIYDTVKNKRLLKFVEQNMEIVRDSKYVMNSIKSTSTHACATIIVPRAKTESGKEIDLFSQIPVRVDGDILVSEWEGELLADIGYLKEDILSTRQMAKFGHIVKLIEENTGILINIDSIPLDDDGVYDLHRRGLNQDVFHFGTSGLTAYLKLVKPFHIEDMIATISLYRPGVMASGTHTKYISLRNGDESVIYDHPLLEEITKNTYGLMIYQEQIMMVAQALGGFTLVEADGVRKAMGKMIKSKMEEYRELFIKGASKNDCDEAVAVSIWNKMEVFSSYGFNKSHAAAYSIIGYQCNWLKYHYPLEFWTIALEFADAKNIPMMVSEVNGFGSIEVKGPDINVSLRQFHSSVSKQTIYWNLNQISYIGPAALEVILTERDSKGRFFSLEEFCSRVGSGVKKTGVINCIVSGCFDEVENIQKPQDRFRLIVEYLYSIRDDMRFSREHKIEFQKLEEAGTSGEDPVFTGLEMDKIVHQYIPQEYVINKKNDYYWILKQSEICKINLLDYKTLVRDFDIKEKVLEGENFGQTVSTRGSKFVVPGILMDVKMRTTKTNKPYCTGTIQQDSSLLSLRMWSDAIDSCDMTKFTDGALVILKGKLYLNDYVSSNEFLVNSFKEIL